MEEELGAGGLLDAAHPQDVIDVGVGVGDDLDLQPHVSRQVQDVFCLVPGVDGDGLPCAPGADDPAVLGEDAHHDAPHHQFAYLRFCHLDLACP